MASQMRCPPFAKPAVCRPPPGAGKSLNIPDFVRHWTWFLAEVFMTNLPAPKGWGGHGSGFACTPFSVVALGGSLMKTAPAKALP